MGAAFLRKYGTGTGADVYTPMIKRGVVDFAVGADWTPAAGDVKVSKDGAAAANIGTLPVAVAMGNTALWKWVFADAELQCKCLAVFVADSATKAVEDQAFVIETYGNASAMYVPDFSDGVRMGMTALPNAAAEAAGGLYTRGSGAGQINQPANGLIDANTKRWNGTAVPAEHTAGYPIVTVKDGTGTGEIDTASGVVLAKDHTGANLATAANLATVAGYIDTEVADIQSRLPAALTSDGNMKSDALRLGGTVQTGRDVGASVLLTPSESRVVRTGTAQAGSINSITLDSGASSVNSVYNGDLIKIDSGTGAGQTNIISGYIGSSKFATLSRSWTTNPDNTSVYTITSQLMPKVDDSQGVTLAAAAITAIWAALTSGMTTAGSIGKKLADWVVGTIDTYTGNTKQTGDNFTRLGAPVGASLSADLAAVKAQTAAIDAKTTNLPSAPADETLIIAATDAVMARVGAPVGASISADLAAVKGDTAAVKTKTDFLPSAAAGAAGGVAIVGSNMGTVSSVTGNVGGNVVGSVASVTAGVTLAAAAVQAIWDALVSNLTVVGTIGKRIVDFLDIAISSRLAGSSYTAPDNATISAINSKTTNLPSDPADQSLIIAATDAVMTRLGAPVGASLSADLAAAPGLVWDEALADHPDSGSTGAALAGAGAAGDPWSTALPGAYGAGTAGKIIGDNLNATIASRAPAATALSSADYTAGRAAKLDELDAAVSSCASQASMDAVGGAVGGIKGKTDQLAFTTPNKVDAALNAAGDLPQAAADKVWSSATRALTDKTGFSLSAAGVQAVWDALTSALTAPGSIGKRIADFLTGDAFARLGAPAGASVSADLAAIKNQTAAIEVDTGTDLPTALSAINAKTTNLPSDPADQSLVIAATDAVMSRLGAPAGASVSADVAAVKAKTDLIPASPAAVGSAMTLASGERNSVADALLDRTDAIEPGLTLRQALRLGAAADVGKLAGAETNTVTIRQAVADSKTRITATVDESGNRTAVSVDLT